MYDALFDVDYTVEYCKYKYVAEMSFTFLHWKLIEMLREKKVNKKIDDKDMTF